MPAPWIPFILASVLLGSISTLLQRTILQTDQSHPAIYSMVFQLMTGLILTLIGVIFTDMAFIDLTGLWPNILLMAGLYGIGNIFVFKALQQTQASIFTILFAPRGLITILAAYLFLRESINFNQLVGVALIFISIVLVTMENFKFKISSSDLNCLLAAICFGLGNANDRFLIKAMPLFPFLTLGFLLPVPLVGAVYYRQLFHLKTFLQPNLISKMLIMSSFYAAAAITFFIALRNAPIAGQVVSVNLIQVVVTVILAMIFLKERDRLIQKFVGGLISFLGLMLLS